MSESVHGSENSLECADLFDHSVVGVPLNPQLSQLPKTWLGPTHAVNEQTNLTTQHNESVQNSINDSLAMERSRSTRNFSASTSSPSFKRPVLRSTGSSASVRTLDASGSTTSSGTMPSAHSRVSTSVPSDPDSSSDSGESSAQPLTVPQSSSRKVAASLQLFKETDPTTVIPASEPAVPSEPRLTPKLDRHKSAHKSRGEEISEAQFVKRAEWPDRENVSLWRDKSVAAQERNKGKDEKEDFSNLNRGRSTAPSNRVRNRDVSRRQQDQQGMIA